MNMKKKEITSTQAFLIKQEIAKLESEIESLEKKYNNEDAIGKKLISKDIYEKQKKAGKLGYILMECDIVKPNESDNKAIKIGSYIHLYELENQTNRYIQILSVVTGLEEKNGYEIVRSDSILGKVLLGVSTITTSSSRKQPKKKTNVPKTKGDQFMYIEDINNIFYYEIKNVENEPSLEIEAPQKTKRR